MAYNPSPAVDYGQDAPAGISPEQELGMLRKQFAEMQEQHAGVRWLGRVLRRANSGVLNWLYANELLSTPEHCYAHWSELRLPWRHEA